MSICPKRAGDIRYFFASGGAIKQRNVGEKSGKVRRVNCYRVILTRLPLVLLPPAGRRDYYCGLRKAIA